MSDEVQELQPSAASLSDFTPNYDLLDLTGERRIVFTEKKHTYTYLFRRITNADWIKFFQGITNQSEDQEKERIWTFDFKTALTVMVTECVLSVEGYRNHAGNANWKNLLPIGHKIAAGLVLKNVEVIDDSNLPASLGELTEVELAVTWTEGDDGKMLRYGGLVHRFRQVTIEQLRKFNREASRARIVGGSRSNKTIFPAQQEMLAGFYNELIVSVDGYRVGDKPLTGDVEVIKREMDLNQKVRAVQELFVATQSDEQEEDAENES